MPHCVLVQLVSEYDCKVRKYLHRSFLCASRFGVDLSLDLYASVVVSDVGDVSHFWAVITAKSACQVRHKFQFDGCQNSACRVRHEFEVDKCIEFAEVAWIVFQTFGIYNEYSSIGISYMSRWDV